LQGVGIYHKGKGASKNVDENGDFQPWAGWWDEKKETGG